MAENVWKWEPGEATRTSSEEDAESDYVQRQSVPQRGNIRRCGGGRRWRSAALLCIPPQAICLCNGTLVARDVL
ncbi:hypothetical protein niasHS_010434 [Heterodera schachtii]|uniref:Uncharacterized protein n=1 Tax=Heterodera schachtii TaxID=97005 RepID=A0ABD2J5A1_HETSC